MEERERERERERESKNHAKIDWIAGLWRMLPQWLKNIPRAIRLQWHGDFYDEFECREDMLLRRFQEQSLSLQQVREQLKKQSLVLQQLIECSNGHSLALRQLNEQQTSELMKQFDGLRQFTIGCHRATLCNQISLANKKLGQRTLYTPWFMKKSFHLDMSVEGHLCFEANESPPTRQRRVFVQTTPKSGTYFMGAILKGLGFKDVGAHSFYHCYDDGRKFKTNNSWVVIDDEQLVTRSDLEVPLPFSVQVGLLQPNQFMVGHFPSKDFVLDLRLHDEDRLLMVIRDLRLCVLSYMRHDARTSPQYKPVSSYTDEDVCAYLHNSRDYLFNIARCCLDLLHEPYVHLVRHEELTAADHAKMNSSVAAISRATGCQHDEVIDAIEGARGTKTRTYSGSPSVLDGIWTKRVEELFVKVGGDVLNEKLGYPKEYIPKT